MHPRNLSIPQATGLIGNGDLSTTELVDSVYDQIERLENDVNAFICLKDRDLALHEARAADSRWRAGAPKSSLDGIPIGLKDNFQTSDMPTTAGSQVLRGWRPTQDAQTVQALRGAGAIFVGKLNLHEFADGTTTDNPHFGRTNNPWDLTRTPAGSSGGSGAALAARMVMAATGSDTGGSIREPAGCCGVVGLKPTHGLLARDGVVPFSWSLDHVGPMGRSVSDVAALLVAMNGGQLPRRTGARGGRASGVTVLGLDEAYLFRIMHPGVRRALGDALSLLESTLDVRVEPVELPVLEESMAAELAILFSEAFVVHQDWLERHAPDYGPDVRRSLLAGALYSGPDYVRAQTLRTEIKRALQEVFQRVDYLVSPTMLVEAPPWGTREFILEGTRVDGVEAFIRTLVPFNLSGHPAMSVPCGVGDEGLPVGLQLVGPYFSEPEMLDFARMVEDVLEGSVGPFIPPLATS
jgi:aspartyl-tRNA(Asn)/glutamyl-tRNA(Gln) amidotransferase subunit A